MISMRVLAQYNSRACTAESVKSELIKMIGPFEVTAKINKIRSAMGFHNNINDIT
jgi:hypothetical protein